MELELDEEVYHQNSHQQNTQNEEDPETVLTFFAATVIDNSIIIIICVRFGVIALIFISLIWFSLVILIVRDQDCVCVCFLRVDVYVLVLILSISLVQVSVSGISGLVVNTTSYTIFTYYICSALLIRPCFFVLVIITMIKSLKLHSRTEFKIQNIKISTYPLIRTPRRKKETQRRVRNRFLTMIIRVPGYKFIFTHST